MSPSPPETTAMCLAPPIIFMWKNPRCGPRRIFLTLIEILYPHIICICTYPKFARLSFIVIWEDMIGVVLVNHDDSTAFNVDKTSVYACLNSSAHNEISPSLIDLY